MKRRALVLLFSCGLLLANYPVRIDTTSHGSSGSATICKRSYHSKTEHYSGTGMCLHYDACGYFVK